MLRIGRVIKLGSFTVGIFSPFFNHFPFHFVSIFSQSWNSEWKKMNVKWNPNLAFAKMDSKNYHFHLFWQCAWREKCIFASFFYNFHSGGFTVTIFHIIFHPIFCFLLFVSLPNTQKWAENEFQNEPKMAQEWLPWTTLLFAYILFFVVFYHFVHISDNNCPNNMILGLF